VSESASSAGPVTVGTVIVGAGLAGVGMGVRLARSGREDFLILERAGRVGGTWRDNVYPGVACDIPSHLYSYSFRPNPRWSRLFAPGGEILDYIEAVVREEGLSPHLRLGEELTAARWDEDASVWLLTTSRGSYRCRVLVLAAGRLAEPRLPQVPGLARFTGTAFHSARWRPGAIAGKRVGVVGTGASAVQLLPHVVREASETTVFQRTPAWVLPRADRPYTAAEQAGFARDGGAMARLRAELFAQAETLFEARIAGSAEASALRERALAHLHAQVPDAALAARLVPRDDIGCRRAVFSDDYYPALTRAGTVLEPSGLAAVEGGTAVAESGARYELDVLVLATGFVTTRPPYARLIAGRGGLSLAEHWRDGMTSHASTVVHGFPDLFILDGPNAALGHNSAIETIEAQHDYVLGALDHLDAHPGAVLEVSARAEAEYTAEIDRLAARTVWTRGGCRSWYLDEESGRLTLLWPERAAEFRRRNGRFDPAAFAGAQPASTASGTRESQSAISLVQRSG